MTHRKNAIVFLTVFILSATIFLAFDRQEPVKDKIQMPFKSIEGWVVLSVRINNSREMNMILDTGMPIGGATLLRPELGKEIGLENNMGRISLGGLGSEGEKYGQISGGATLSFPGIDFPNQRIITFDEDLSVITHVIDGIIGRILFGSYVVEVDFETSMLILYDPSTYSYIGKGKELPLLIRNGYPYLETYLSLNGKNNIPVTLIVDLGARHALSLNLNQEKKIFPSNKSKEGIIGSGVSGDVLGSWGRISQLKLGPFELPGIITAFPIAEEKSEIPRTPRDGNLGSQVLRKFNVVFDYSRERMILTPNKSFSNSFEFNMAGLLLRRHSDGNRLVYDVLEGSSGEKADIQKGDIIISVNGRKTTNYRYNELLEIFEQDGKRVKLTILRNSQQIIKTLKLNRLF